MGLVDRVVPDEEVYEQAHAWAARLAAGPAIALRAAKESVDVGLETDIDSGLAVERNWFAGLFATEDRDHGDAQLRRGRPGQGEVQLTGGPTGLARSAVRRWFGRIVIGRPVTRWGGMVAHGASRVRPTLWGNEPEPARRPGADGRFTVMFRPREPSSQVDAASV